MAEDDHDVALASVRSVACSLSATSQQTGSHEQQTMTSNHPDASLRMAAFMWLDRVSDGGARAVTWRQLTTGFVHEDEVVRLVGQKGIWKPKQARLPISITTAPPKPGKPAPYDDTITDEGLLRYAYEGTNPDHYTNAALRTCLRDQIPLIYFRGIAKGIYLAFWPVLITADHPSELAVDVALCDPGRLRPDLSLEAVGLAEQRYYTRLAKQRLDQGQFRYRVLTAYRTACAMCRLRHDELLDAAHIVPYANRGPSIVTNGLALCKIHHAAFDHHLIGVRPDHVIELRSDVLEEEDGPMLRHGLQELHKRRLLLPRRAADHPSPEYLEQRWEEFRQAS